MRKPIEHFYAAIVVAIPLIFIGFATYGCHVAIHTHNLSQPKCLCPWTGKIEKPLRGGRSYTVRYQEHTEDCIRLQQGIKQ